MTRCDWGYRTTVGLSLHCVLEIDHDGDHLDEFDRHWRTPHEHGPVELVKP